MAKELSKVVVLTASALMSSCSRPGAFLEGHWIEHTVYDPNLYKVNLDGRDFSLWEPPVEPKLNPSHTSFTLDLHGDGTFDMQLRQKYSGDWAFTGPYVMLRNIKMKIITTATKEDRQAASITPAGIPIMYEADSGQLSTSDWGAAANGGEMVFDRNPSGR